MCIHIYTVYIYIFTVVRCSEIEVDIFSDEQTNSVKLNVEARIYTGNGKEKVIIIVLSQM